MKNKIDAFRAQLPFLQDGLFLNYAATAPLTQKTIQDMNTAVTSMQEPLGQRFYQALNQLEFARRSLAELISAKPGEISFTQNTSMAISTVALAVDFQPGDRILVPDNEFPSNYYPWLNLKSKGVLCEKIHIPTDTSLVEVLSRMDLSKVKLISTSAVSYQTGRHYDIKAFADFCREKKILSCVDAIQAIGSIPFNVHDLGVDFMCSGAQKWVLGPVGCGILYAREGILESLKVPFVGWTSVMYPEYLDLGELEFSSDMTRFEPGLPNILPVMGLQSSLVQMGQFGWPEIHRLVAQNAQYMQNHLQNRGLKLINPNPDSQSGIAGFYYPEAIDHRIIEEKFHHERVKITTRKDYVRVAPHFFNTTDELDRFLAAVDKVFSLKTAAKKAEPPREFSVVPAPKEKVVISGAAGNLGQELTRQMAARGYQLLLIDQNQTELEKLSAQTLSQFPKAQITTAVLDLADTEQVRKFLASLKKNPERFAGLINCAGVIGVGLYTEMPEAELEKIYRVNYLALSLFTRAFMRELASAQSVGVLNVVSSTGRCGSPLISEYSASNAALWTLSESLAREQSTTQKPVMTFVAPAMHSPMQKRIGRDLLRYFKAEGAFDYETAPVVAAQVIESFTTGRLFFIAKMSRAKIFMNTLFPEYVSGRIRKQWYLGNE